MGGLAALPNWAIWSAIGTVATPAAVVAALKWLLPWWADQAERRRQGRAEGNREWEAKLKDRAADLDRREHEFKQRLQEGLAECERHCSAIKDQFETLRDDHKVVVLVVRIALPKLQADAPDSPEMRMIRTLLATRFPPDPNIPDDMIALLGLLDEKTAAPAAA